MFHGGGWGIRGRLEAEITIDAGLLQLYSKATTKRTPGITFFYIDSRYDRKKYPIWEFRLILRNPVQREEIRTLKSVPVSSVDVLMSPWFRLHPDDPQCPQGERCPRGELQYEAESGLVMIRIEGVRDPFSVAVPLPESSAGASGEE